MCDYVSAALQGVLTMQVTHAGYSDPNNLKFDNITILGIPVPPVSISVTHVGTTNSTTTLEPSNIHHDGDKKVNT